MDPTPGKASQPAGRLNEFAWILGLALLASLADWFAPVIFSGHSLVLGVVFYWVAWRSFGPKPAILVLLTSTALLTVKWSQPYSALIIAAESVWVGFAWQKGRHPLLADVLYWALVGTPASWYLYKHVYPIPHPSFEQALVVQFVNGAIAVWIALVITGMLGIHGNSAGPKTTDSFRAFLLKRYLGFGTFPVLIAGLLAARQFERGAISEARSILAATAENLAMGVSKQVETGYDVVTLTAARVSHLEKLSGERVEPELRAMHARAKMFVTMLAADPTGKVVATSVWNATGGLDSPTGVNSVADRPYFTIPMKEGVSHVSDVFLGRGLGQDVLVAVSAPVVTESGARIGVIEGSWKVVSLETLLQSERPNEAWRMLLTDRSQQVIAVAGNDLRPLTALGGTPLGRFIQRPDGRTPARFNDEVDGERISYLSVTVPVPGTQWAVTVQRSWAEILSPITTGYLALLGVALVAAGIAVVFTTWSIRDFLHGWNLLLAFARNPAPHSVEIQQSTQLDLPREFKELITNLEAMAHRLESERQQRTQLLEDLESLVQMRTHELREALADAQAADRAKSAFLATVSHELRTPLTSIIAGTKLMGMSPTPKSEMEVRTLRTLEKSSQVLMSVISNVLDYSKLEAGAVEIIHQPFKPVSLVNDVVTILAPTARQAGLTLTTDLQLATEFEWFGDAPHLRQVLVNLVGNAIKFTQKGGITIRAWTTAATADQPARLHFSVQDTGAGISSGQLESIFQPFVQLPNARASSQAGTGLGLPISRKLVRAMGGDLTVTSELDVGSTFSFWVS